MTTYTERSELYRDIATRILSDYRKAKKGDRNDIYNFMHDRHVNEYNLLVDGHIENFTFISYDMIQAISTKDIKEYFNEDMSESGFSSKMSKMDEIKDEQMSSYIPAAVNAAAVVTGIATTTVLANETAKNEMVSNMMSRASNNITSQAKNAANSVSNIKIDSSWGVPIFTALAAAGISALATFGINRYSQPQKVIKAPNDHDIISELSKTYERYSRGNLSFSIQHAASKRNADIQRDNLVKIFKALPKESHKDYIRQNGLSEKYVEEEIYPLVYPDNNDTYSDLEINQVVDKLFNRYKEQPLLDTKKDLRKDVAEYGTYKDDIYNEVIHKLNIHFGNTEGLFQAMGGDSGNATLEKQEDSDDAASKKQRKKRELELKKQREAQDLFELESRLNDLGSRVEVKEEKSTELRGSNSKPEKRKAKTLKLENQGLEPDNKKKKKDRKKDRKKTRVAAMLRGYSTNEVPIWRRKYHESKRGRKNMSRISLEYLTPTMKTLFSLDGFGSEPHPIKGLVEYSDLEVIQSLPAEMSRWNLARQYLVRSKNSFYMTTDPDSVTTNDVIILDRLKSLIQDLGSCQGGGKKLNMNNQQLMWIRHWLGPGLAHVDDMSETCRKRLLVLSTLLYTNRIFFKYIQPHLEEETLWKEIKNIPCVHDQMNGDYKRKCIVVLDDMYFGCIRVIGKLSNGATLNKSFNTEYIVVDDISDLSKCSQLEYIKHVWDDFISMLKSEQEMTYIASNICIAPDMPFLSDKDTTLKDAAADSRALSVKIKNTIENIDVENFPNYIHVNKDRDIEYILKHFDKILKIDTDSSLDHIHPEAAKHSKYDPDMKSDLIYINGMSDHAFISTANKLQLNFDLSSLNQIVHNFIHSVDQKLIRDNFKYSRIVRMYYVHNIFMVQPMVLIKYKHLVDDGLQIDICIVDKWFAPMITDLDDESIMKASFTPVYKKVMEQTLRTKEEREVFRDILYTSEWSKFISVTNRTS